jgi:8-oxo-dGTP pyrophosphatase MutT (NUDIX family)
MIMPRDPIPTWYFVLVVVRQIAEDDRFLVVHEAQHGQLWYLPAGRVEPGETLESAALRETLEETGVAVELDGVLRVEHTPIRMNMSDCARLRVFFSAHPADDTPPKSTPDEHSLEAAWVTLDELRALPLRGPDVYEVLHHVAHGGAAYPLDLITYEGAPWS